MNGRLAKKIRREARKRDSLVLPALKDFINHLSFKERVRIALNILRRKF